jgi:hypothetical protein
VIAISTLLLAGAAFGFGQTRAWFPLYQNLPEGSATIATNDAIAADFGEVFRMIVETDGTWDDLRALVGQLEAVSGAGTVLSEVSFARWLGHPAVRPTQDALQMLPTALTGQLRTRDGMARIFVSVPEPMRDAASLAQFDTVYAIATEGGPRALSACPRSCVWRLWR